LIDQAVYHFGEWFLIGTSVTAHWAPSGQVLAADPNNMDITNNYIAIGIQGGLLGLVLFIAIIVACFKIVGRKVRSQDSPFPPKFIWAIGVSLACHCTAMVSISYFDQIQVFWFWLLAVFATIWGLHRRKIVQRIQPTDTAPVSPVVLPERSAEGLRYSYL
jgi:O-antigen ligase